MVTCSICQTKTCPEYRYVDGAWTCRYCFTRNNSELAYFKEMGVENPLDPKGSTAHVRDIKSRMLDFKTGKVYNYEAPKTYFFPKG